ncbi:MAG: DNA-processing protein DprA, partial [Acidobacteriota bacterium]
QRDHELAALTVLLRSKAMPIERLAAAVENFGAVHTLQTIAHDSQLAPKFGTSDLEAAMAAVATWAADGRDVRTVFDRTYPQNLSAIFNKPPLIFVKGTWREDSDSLSVAVVGTRKPSPDGVKRAQVAARKLARAGITVISGLAAGIDTAAHAAALEAGGRTIAVMGTGIDRVYPGENRALAERIVQSGGGLVSQFFPEQPPTQWSFPMRNVTMSGLSLATLVIEAAETSGARQQARHALQHGRSVFLAASLVRSHEWARRMVDRGYDGAHAIVVESVDDVIDRIVGVHDSPAVAAG